MSASSRLIIAPFSNVEIVASASWSNLPTCGRREGTRQHPTDRFSCLSQSDAALDDGSFFLPSSCWHFDSQEDRNVFALPFHSLALRKRFPLSLSLFSFVPKNHLNAKVNIQIPNADLRNGDCLSQLERSRIIKETK